MSDLPSLHSELMRARTMESSMDDATDGWRERPDGLLELRLGSPGSRN